MVTPSSRPQYKLDLGGLPPLVPNQPSSRPSSAASSPVEPLQGSNGRFAGAFVGSSYANADNARVGAGSPSHDRSGRLYPRRAREIQASEGHAWGPPTASGLSTPLRETIPESPDDNDSFPDFSGDLPAIPSRNPSVRRARAGTVPSRFSFGSDANGSASQPLSASRSTRATPSPSPHRPSTATIPDSAGPRLQSSSSSLSSRFRAGSMPQRSAYTSSPFGPSVFSTNWNVRRDRSSTLGSQGSNGSLGMTTASKDPLYDTDVKTLSYLGLEHPAETLAYENESGTRYGLGMKPMVSDLNRITSNRFRSYSANAKEIYSQEDDIESAQAGYGSGTLTPSAQVTAALYAATQAQIAQHNAAVQAFATQATSSRPRAQTAGLLDSPSRRFWRGGNATGPSRLEHALNASDFSIDDSIDYGQLTRAVQAMQLQNGLVQQEMSAPEESTRSIWLGGVPASTTPSSLKVIFDQFGKIESARVLTDKSCGFINFASKESAALAKVSMSGKEIFPGAGPIRIGYAKTRSGTASPGQEAQASVGPVDQYQFGPASSEAKSATQAAVIGNGQPQHPRLPEISTQILDIVNTFGSTAQEQVRVSEMIDRAMQHQQFVQDIPPPPETSHVRLYDAPRLREIRKRIDNQSCQAQEIEEMAQQMLPEIAELASDYLGNTVVQKLFEHCSESTKEAMLSQIAPFIAQIGVHKNGTWAAQKIIDVANTPLQRQMIVDGLRPYGLAAFLDQYGNYVMQCCLKFGAPTTDFLFECMLSQIWKLSEARFGARAMRACLESSYTSKDQQKMIAAAIVLHSDQLAMNTNGALLLTWYLDTYNLKNRRHILAERLVPHLVQLCTHKVAYMTVLKVINQRDEPEGRDTMLRALFFSNNDETLEAVLKDQACGATFVFKVLTTPFFDDQMRADIIENTRRTLTQMKVLSNQGYKRLMDEVGMTRGSLVNNRENVSSSGPTPKKGRSHHTPNSSTQAGGASMNGGFYPQMASQGPYTAGLNADMAHSLDPFISQNLNSQSYTSNTLPSPMTPHAQLAYQQIQQQAFNSGRSANTYAYAAPMMNPASGYPTPISGNFISRSPHQQPQVSMNGYSPMMGMPQGQWQQYQNPYIISPLAQQQMQMHPGMIGGGGGVGQRRGRVSGF